MNEIKNQIKTVINKNSVPFGVIKINDDQKTAPTGTFLDTLFVHDKQGWAVSIAVYYNTEEKIMVEMGRQTQ